jgi:DNA-binding transcriptional regulator PaaX
MSQFLIRMRSEGLLVSRKEGTHVYYGIADARTKKLLKAIKEIYCR